MSAGTSPGCLVRTFEREPPASTDISMQPASVRGSQIFKHYLCVARATIRGLLPTNRGRVLSCAGKGSPRNSSACPSSRASRSTSCSPAAPEGSGRVAVSMNGITSEKRRWPAARNLGRSPPAVRRLATVTGGLQLRENRIQSPLVDKGSIYFWNQALKNGGHLRRSTMFRPSWP